MRDILCCKQFRMMLELYSCNRLFILRTAETEIYLPVYIGSDVLVQITSICLERNLLRINRVDHSQVNCSSVKAIFQIIFYFLTELIYSMTSFNNWIVEQSQQRKPCFMCCLPGSVYTS